MAAASRPIVSVVVAAKGCLPELQLFVTRFRDTKPSSTELVIIDGNSSDGTAKWLAALPQDDSAPIRWLSESDRGIADAWNKGIALAKGEWVVFLGADDAILDSAAWRSAVNLLEAASPSCGLVVAPTAILSPTGRRLVVERVGIASPDMRWLARHGLAHQGVFHRRELWVRYGGFDASFLVAADYEFILRLVSAGEEVVVLQGEPATGMTFGGLSKRSPFRNLCEFQRARWSHGVRESVLWQAGSFSRAIARAIGTALLPPSVVGRCADLVRWLRGLPPVWTVP